MNIHQFIMQNRIQPADAIILRKKFFGMVDHFVIYVGVYQNRHRFVANYTKGVRDISQSELNEFLRFLDPTKIEKFPGSENSRQDAVKRALSRLGENRYNIGNNNCEHFKNWVHFGKHESRQVENFKAGAGAVAGVALLALFIDSLFKRS